MNTLRYFAKFTWLTAKKLCQQRWLLAGLVLLCFLLPLGASQAAGYLLSRGVDFNGVTLAVTAPEEDDVPQLLEQFMGGMEDIAQYCRITAMEEETAMDALSAGEVTAVLVLPENFIRRVMWGENPDLRLVVDDNRPLESLLLLWVGQSACDILSAFQSGIYAVLDCYDEADPPPGLDRDQVVVDINLRYLSLTTGRAGFFQTELVSATQTLPIPLHYALSFSIYLALSAAPVFVPFYTGSWLRFQRRLRSVGRGAATGYFSALAAGLPTVFLLLFPLLLMIGEGASLPALLGISLLMALFCCVFCSVCCLVTRSARECGLVSFVISLLSLALAGGIIPPVLLPGPVRKLSSLSPLGWLRQAAAGAMGYETPVAVWACLIVSIVVMSALGLMLYARRVEKEEAAS